MLHPYRGGVCPERAAHRVRGERPSPELSRSSGGSEFVAGEALGGTTMDSNARISFSISVGGAS